MQPNALAFALIVTVLTAGVRLTVQQAKPADVDPAVAMFLSALGLLNF